MGNLAIHTAGLHRYYRRHQPETTILYQTIANHFESWLAERGMNDEHKSLPDFVTKEFRAFLDCGIFTKGMVKTSCPKCQTMQVTAFSCKKRGFCPSCGAKRSSETSIHLTENVLPLVPYRQYVVTFPYSLRFWMATSRKLTNLIHKIASEEIASFYSRVAAAKGILLSEPGGMSFLQRFGSACNLNLHFHIIVAEGVWSTASGILQFFHLRGPSDEDTAAIIKAISGRSITCLKENGYISDDDADASPNLVDNLFANTPDLLCAASASINHKIAFGENAGKNIRRIGRGFHVKEEVPLITGKRIASMNGFTLHAGRFIGAQERSKLADLISYATRPAISHARLSAKDPLDQNSDIIVKLKTPWQDGTEAIVLKPFELLEKLAILVPPPHMHLTRYFGAFSSHSALRPHIILKPGVKKGFITEDGGGHQDKVVRLTRSRLLAKVFKIDISHCQKCGTTLDITNHIAIVDSDSIKRILAYLNIQCHPPPVAPARRYQPELEFSGPESESSDT